MCRRGRHLAHARPLLSCAPATLHYTPTLFHSDCCSHIHPCCVVFTSDNQTENEKVLRALVDELELRGYEAKIQTQIQEIEDRKDALRELPEKCDLVESAKKIEKEMSDRNNEVQRIDGQIQAMNQQVRCAGFMGSLEACGKRAPCAARMAVQQ